MCRERHGTICGVHAPIKEMFILPHLRQSRISLGCYRGIQQLASSSLNFRRWWRYAAIGSKCKFPIIWQPATLPHLGNSRR